MAAPVGEPFAACAGHSWQARFSIAASASLIGASLLTLCGILQRLLLCRCHLRTTLECLMRPRCLLQFAAWLIILPTARILHEIIKIEVPTERVSRPF